MKVVDKLGLNSTATKTAAAALDAVEAGWATVYVPGYLLVPLKLLNDALPSLVEALCAIGPAGRRATAKKAA